MKTAKMLDITTPTSQTSLLLSPTTENGGYAMSDDKKDVKLKKELGLMDGMAIIVGVIVGSGIFISPRGVLQEAGSPGMALVVWTLCGLLSMVGALCYAELGTAIPRSGGDYAYIFESFGPLPAFLFLWCAVLVVIPTTNAIMALTFANYIIQPLIGNCAPPDNAVRLLAAAAICFLTFLNCYNVKWATHVQGFLMFFKIAALVIIIIAGFVWLGKGHTANFDQAFHGSTTDPGLVALSFYSGLFSYAGWNYLNFVTEELKNPYKNLPRAIGLSLPLVTLINVFANVAYFVVLTPAEILASNAVAVTFSERITNVIALIMPVFVAGSTFGGLSVHIFASARICFVGARQGHFPNSLALITLDKFAPAPALIFLGTVSVLILSVTDLYVLINYTSFVESMFILWSICGLLWLRWKRPLMHRPIKVNLIFPIFFLLVSSFLVILPLWVRPKEVGAGLAIMVTGVPVYFVTIYWQKKPDRYQKILSASTKIIQKIFLAVRQEGETN